MENKNGTAFDAVNAGRFVVDLQNNVISFFFVVDSKKVFREKLRF